MNAATEQTPPVSLGRRIATWSYLHPGYTLLLWLLLPLGWFGLLYLGSLANLLVQSFYTFDDFTLSVLPEWTLDNYRQLLNPSNLDIVIRTVSMAVAVTLADALLAFPIASIWRSMPHRASRCSST